MAALFAMASPLPQTLGDFGGLYRTRPELAGYIAIYIAFLGTALAELLVLARRYASVRYLIDTSALVRILRRQVDESWHEQETHGMVAICDPVLTEVLTIARATEYERVRKSLLDAYPWVPVPDRAWDTVHSVQSRLAAKSEHHGLSVADHLVVATALHHHLTILHEDAGFGTAAAVVSGIQQQPILAGE